MPICTICRDHIRENCLEWLSLVLCSTDSEREVFIELMEEDPESYHKMLHSPHTMQAVLESAYAAEEVDFHIATYVGLSRLLLQRGVDDASLADYLTAMLGKFLFEVDWVGTEFSRPAAYVDHLIDAIAAEAMIGDKAAVLRLETHLANYCLFVSTVMVRTFSPLELDADGEEALLLSLSEMSRERFLSVAAQDVVIPLVYSAIGRDFEAVCDALVSFVEGPFV